MYIVGNQMDVFSIQENWHVHLLVLLLTLSY